jgi:hypothetical protein
MPKVAGKRCDQILRAGERAGKAFAHPHRDRRRRVLTLLHYVEVGVKGRDLIHFGERELHFLGERSQMCRRQMAEAILNEVQMFDEKIALPRSIAQQCAHVCERRRVDLSALRRARGAAADRFSLDLFDGRFGRALDDDGPRHRCSLLLLTGRKQPPKDTPGAGQDQVLVFITTSQRALYASCFFALLASLPRPQRM